MPLSKEVTPLAVPQRTKVIYDSYILCPGDSLQIELLDIPLAERHLLDRARRHHLPGAPARSLRRGLTVEELCYFLT